ncbi:hypothetical protein HMPREF9466_00524 [Fusobacterium necrophorum subsp. funduliforme 1_1_36S]|nr:hypothetical protein HMPREF9466_00524 [Fusobacterium necrophorum subsp. funduliforme 1_1_36S]
MKKYFVAVSISLALSYQIFAEENPVIKLNETVITSESFGTNILRTPKNITVITARNIKIQGAKNIEDALRGVAGLTAYNNMGGSDPKNFSSRNGSGKRRTKYSVFIRWNPL